MTPLQRLSVVCESSPIAYDGRRNPMRSSRGIHELLAPYFAALDREHFVVVPLDGKNRPLGFHTVSIGTLTTGLVHPREVLKIVVLMNAHAIVLAHNHPSGDPTPSAEDIAVTQRLRQVGELMGVRVLDHVVFGHGTYVSFCDTGL